MEIGEFPASFSVPFYPLPSLSTGLTPSDFGGEKGEGEKQEKEIGDGEKGKTEELLRRAVPGSSAKSWDEGQVLLNCAWIPPPYPLDFYFLSPCVVTEFWKSFRLLHFDRIFKQAVLMLKDPNQSIDTICTTSIFATPITCTLARTHTPPYKLHGLTRGKIPVTD